MPDILCSICHNPGAMPIYIQSNTFPVCKGCITTYGKKEIRLTFIGIIKLAEARVFTDKKERAKAWAAYRKAGKLLAVRPSLSMLLMSRAFMSGAVLDLP